MDYENSECLSKVVQVKADQSRMTCVKVQVQLSDQDRLSGRLLFRDFHGQPKAERIDSNGCHNGDPRGAKRSNPGGTVVLFFLTKVQKIASN